MFWASTECMQLYSKKNEHLYLPYTFSHLCMYFNFCLFVDDEFFSLSL